MKSILDTNIQACKESGKTEFICELTSMVVYLPDENLTFIPGVNVAVCLVTWLRRIVSPTWRLVEASFLHRATSAHVVLSEMMPFSTSMSLPLYLEGIV